MTEFASRSTINGASVDGAALRQLALVNYGHFTTMRVDAGAVLGLDLHLQRLQAATRDLFGHDLNVALVRDWMRALSAGIDDSFVLRATVFSRDFNREHAAAEAAPDVLLTTSAMRPAFATPLRVATSIHQRVLPRIKHLGTFELFHQQRLARQRGFDDVLFVDDAGVVAEGSIWNIGFLERDHVVLPLAPILDGVAQQVLQRGLARLGIGCQHSRIHLDELAGFRGAFFSNSVRGIQPIGQIDAIEFGVDPERFAQLNCAYRLEAAQDF